MPSIPGEYADARESMSPSERAKQERRIARAIQQGLSEGKLRARFHVSRQRLEKIAQQFSLQIAAGPKGGAGRW